MSVVLYHVDFIAKGAFGVDIFFVISGFIICYVTACDPSDFLPKRLIRVVPLYWAGTLGVFLLAVIAPRLLQTGTTSPEGLLKSLLFIPYEKEPGRGLYPILFLGWTLNYEMFFYGLFALALRVRRLRAPLAAGTLIAILVAAGRAIDIDSALWRFYTSPMLLEFAYGIGIYCLWARYRHLHTNIGAPLILAIAALGLLCMSLSGNPESENRFLLWGLPSAAVVAAVLAMQDRLRFPMALVLVGDASYSLYLFHPYVLKAIEKTISPMAGFSPRSLFAMFIFICVSLLMALLIYRYFERPATSRLRRWVLRSGRKPVLAGIAAPNQT